MNTSLEINALVTALAKARAAFPSIHRSKTVKVKSDRGSYDFSYAPIEDILDGVTPVLSAHELVLIGGTALDPDGSLLVVTRVAHSSGQ
jgi:hypothetical protein